jgi:hypothetical protein
LKRYKPVCLLHYRSKEVCLLSGTAKYFHERYGNSHQDAIYGVIDIRHPCVWLRRAFTVLCREAAAQQQLKFLVMHGSLIGWSFNQRILPWDIDIDVCVLGESEIKKATSWEFENESYIWRVNPYHTRRDVTDRENVIDARFICKRTGVFIDVTFLTPALPERPDTYHCKSPHYYLYDDLFPVQESQFEQCDVYVPHRAEAVLRQEYGAKVSEPVYGSWVFVDGVWQQKESH